MRNQQAIKLFLVLILSTTYIFSFSHFGALAYDSVMNKDSSYAEGTSIGTISIAGKTSNEALALIDEQLTKWLNETSITVKYKEKEANLDLSYFIFDLEGTVNKVKHGQQSTAKVELELLDDFLYTLSPSLDINDFLMDELKGELLRSASLLEVGSYQIRLEDFLVNGNSEEQSIIAESAIQPEFVENELELFIGKTIEISPISQFSLLKYVEEELGEVSSLTLSKIATAIYEVILPTNFSIIERHIGNELPDYASLGFEAKADTKLNYDLIFSNPNELNYLIEFEKKNDSIYVYLNGPALLNRYEILTEDKETFEPKIIRQFNPQLGPTEIKVKVEGKEGQLIKVFREHRDEMGAILKKELISEDFYPPVHQIEIQGLIVKEGNSTITPGTETGTQNGDSQDSSSSDSGNSDQETDGQTSNSEGGSNKDDLWGKENEIPK